MRHAALAYIPLFPLLFLAPAARASHANPNLLGGPGHPPPEVNQGLSPDSPTTAPHLKYYGGRVVSSAKIVQVLWGSGTYLPQVSSTSDPSVATFYQTVLNSAYVDWLSEYNTTVPGGTNQTIGRGSFVQQVTINPSVLNSTITDAQIQAEIVAQLSAGHLPAPQTDAAGNTNTIYMIYFPAGMTITAGGLGTSCTPSGFCAYHGTIDWSPELYYGVFPDFQFGNCATVCAGPSSTFGNVTTASSHELVETITDPEVQLSAGIGPPLAWYDNTYAEIGDICSWNQGSISGYVVQREFSNLANACIVTPPATNDFSVSLTPAIVPVAQGSSGSATVSTQTTSGSPQSVVLSVSGLPPGVSGGYVPGTVLSGVSSTLSLTVTAGVSPGSYPFTVTGTAASGSHGASGTLVVVAAGTRPLVNGGFELGNFTGWTTAGASETIGSVITHGGAHTAALSGSGDSTITQTFVAEAGAAQLSFWYLNDCRDLLFYDWAVATLTDTTANTSSTILPRTCSAFSPWQQVTAPVTAGHAYCLTLASHDDGFPGGATSTQFDDVTIVCGTAADCDDDNPCTDDACVLSGCVHTNNTAPCSDGNACTTGDVCAGGSCQPGGALDCDDGNACTIDNCAPATGCIHTDNSAACTDGDPCTDDHCDPVSGCFHTNNSAPCDDGNPCTTGDTCRGDVCGGGTTAPTEVLSNNGFETGAGATNCAANPFQRNGWTGTGSALQHSGCPWSGPSVTASLGYPAGNTPGTISQAFSATPGPGTLSYQHGTALGQTCSYTVTFAPSGTVVSLDGVALPAGLVAAATVAVPAGTTSLTFGNVSCLGGDILQFDDVSVTSGVPTTLNCDDGNACTGDSCNPASGCVHANLTVPCNDGNACTTGDTCRGGVCGGGTGAPVEELGNKGFEAGTGATGCAPNPFQRESWSGTGSALQHSGCPWSGPDITVSLGYPGGSSPGTISQVFPATPGPGTLSYQHGTSLGGTCSYTVTFGPSSTVISFSNVALAPGLIAAPTVAVPAGTTSLTFGNVSCIGADLFEIDNVSLTAGVATVLNCNDGNGCTDDSCSPASGCVHTPNPAPPETQNGVAAADKATYSWSTATASTRYDVVRGSLAAFPVGPGGGDESCFDNLPSASLSDATVPAPGTGFWYLSRGENSCGNGTWGNATSGPRVTSTCP